MEAYLNNNYYGNRSYGVAAAAQIYWKKDLKDLTLAQYALLAGIPKSPTSYDLVRNAIEEEYTDEKGKVQTRLVVPQNARGAAPQPDPRADEDALGPLRRTYTDADFEAAKTEPVILAAQVADPWRAPALRVAGAQGAGRAPVRRGPVRADRHRRLQGDHLPRLQDAADHREVGLRGRDHPQQQEPGPQLKARQIPRSEWAWIKELRGHNIHNAAAGVVDYRTGEILSYAGSASYTAKGSKKMQPQFDVLADGWRQPGSSIKPLVYLIGIDDKTMTAATMFMDVVTNFAPRARRRTRQPRQTTLSGGRYGCAAPSSSRSTCPPSRPAS